MDAAERSQPAADALLRVMEHHIATGELPVPDGALFVDADAARTGRSIAEALDEDRPVVLVKGDGTWHVIPAPTAA